MNQKKIVKIIDNYRADELGLPLIIKGVPVIKIDGHEVLDIDYSKISEFLFVALIMKPMPLSGAEIRFMRIFMGFTLEALATKLHVTHPTILSWEKCENDFTKMTDTTEAMFRIFSAKEGVKDNELIMAIANEFFDSPWPKNEKTSKKATIVELSTFTRDDVPNIYFSDKEQDLQFFQEA